MDAIGVDTHKDTLAACLVDELGTALDERTFANDPAGHRALFDWASASPEATIGVEGSSSFGAPAARFLIAAGRLVREVPPQLSRRERIRTRRPGKSDPTDALAIARVTAREHELPPVRLVDASYEIQLLVEAREDVVAETTRVRNRLHADLRVLVPGYGATVANLTAVRHQATVARLLRRLDGIQPGLARTRLARLRALAAEERALAARIADRVAGHPLLELPGAGVLVTAKLIGEVGDIGRFRSSDAFAALAGVAPIPASSGQTQRCASTAAVTVNSTGRCTRSPWPRPGTIRRRRRTSPRSEPRARAGAMPSGPSSANSYERFSACSRRALDRSRWPLDKIGAW